MNTIKGFDRIILVLAVIAIAPGIILGGDYAIRNFKELTPEYSEYIKNPSAWHDKKEAEWNKNREKLIKNPPAKPDIFDREQMLSYKKDYIPKKYSETATWKRKVSATIGGVQGFLIVFIGLNGLRKLFFRIAAGFKDDDTEKAKKAFEDSDIGKQG